VGRVRENREEGGKQRGEKSTLLLYETLIRCQSGKKNKLKSERVGGERGRIFPATSLVSAHCKLPVAASLAPALLSPVASAPKFPTTSFPAGNVYQDTFRI